MTEKPVAISLVISDIDVFYPFDHDGLCAILFGPSREVAYLPVSMRPVERSGYVDMIGRTMWADLVRIGINNVYVVNRVG